MADPQEKTEEVEEQEPQPEDPEPSSPPATPGGEEADQTDLSDKLKLSEQTNHELSGKVEELETKLSEAAKQLEDNTAELDKIREEQRLSDIAAKVDESIRLGGHKPADRDDIIQFAKSLDSMEKVNDFIKLSSGGAWTAQESEPEEKPDGDDEDSKLSESGKTVIT